MKNRTKQIRVYLRKSVSQKSLRLSAFVYPACPVAPEDGAGARD